jgi:hypothetical protein
MMHLVKRCVFINEAFAFKVIMPCLLFIRKLHMHIRECVLLSWDCISGTLLLLSTGYHLMVEQKRFYYVLRWESGTDPEFFAIW